MVNPELIIFGILRAMVEVALLALLGQGILALLSGAQKATNPIYRLFALVTRPVIRAARLITPRPILDRHLPVVTFLLLLWLWIFLAWMKRLVAN
jgi:hypothetical protein